MASIDKSKYSNFKFPTSPPLPIRSPPYQQLVKTINSPDFFSMLEKGKDLSKKIQKPLKFNKYCPNTNKKCNKLYRHYVVTNDSKLKKLLLNPNTKNIEDYIKYLLEIQNETKKAGIKNHNLLVDIFLEKLYSKNSVVFFNIINEESYINSTLNPNLKGGNKTKRKKRYSRNKSMKKKTTVW